MDAQFVVDRPQMNGDGVAADVELFGDDQITETLGQELQDLLFPGGERIERLFFRFDLRGRQAFDLL